MNEREVVNCRPLGFVKKLGAAWGVLLIVVGGMWGGATVIANRRMNKAEAAWKAMRMPTREGKMREVTLPEGENAAAAFQKASQRIVGDSPSSANATYELRYQPFPGEWFALAKQAAMANTAVYTAAVAAAKLKASDWGVNPMAPFAPMGAFNGARALTCLLCDEAMRQHLLGDDAWAFDLLEANLRLAETLAAEPGLVVHLTACGIDQLGTRMIPQMAASLKIGEGKGEVPAARVREMVRRLKEPRMRFGGEVWAGEYLYMKGISRQMNKGRFALRPLTTAIEAASTERLVIYEGLGDRVLKDGELGRGPFEAVGGIERVTEGSRRIQLDRAIAATALMVAVCRAERGGAWPENGEEIAGVYGEALPKDPYRADGGPLDYVRTGVERRAVIRGVGTDGVLPEGLPQARVAPWEKVDGPKYTITLMQADKIVVWVDLTLYLKPKKP